MLITFKKVYELYEKGKGDNGYKLWQVLILMLIGTGIILGATIQSNRQTLGQVAGEAIMNVSEQPVSKNNNAKLFMGHEAAFLRQQNYPPLQCTAKDDQWDNIDIIKNCTYTVGTNWAPMWIVKLTDGRYVFMPENPYISHDADKDGPSYVVFENSAQGDLNGDNKDDTAVVLRVNYGGTGNWLNMIVLVQASDGRFEQIANYMFEDREMVYGLYINNRIITAHVVLHGDDPLCCPSVYDTLRFRIID